MAFGLATEEVVALEMEVVKRRDACVNIVREGLKKTLRLDFQQAS